jgi:response regulator RpfG family c-di-GMP phosphodiesterase
MLTRVPEIGHRLLAKIPRLESVAEMVLYQKKNYDGTGFPKEPISGEEILSRHCREMIFH